MVGDRREGSKLVPEQGQTLLLTSPDGARPLGCDGARHVDLTRELLARLPDAAELGDREHEAVARLAEPGGRLRLETTRAEVRSALAQAYDRLLADLADCDDLLVTDLQLALAEQLDLRPLTHGRRRLVWLVPGQMRGGKPRLYQGLTPPAVLSEAHLRECHDDSC